LEGLSFDQSTADSFSKIRAKLYQQEKPIAPYDMMIAGYARSSGLVLVTDNTKEFRSVLSLMVENRVLRPALYEPLCIDLFEVGQAQQAHDYDDGNLA